MPTAIGYSNWPLAIWHVAVCSFAPSSNPFGNDRKYYTFGQNLALKGQTWNVCLNEDTQTDKLTIRFIKYRFIDTNISSNIIHMFLFLSAWLSRVWTWAKQVLDASAGSHESFLLCKCCFISKVHNCVMCW